MLGAWSVALETAVSENPTLNVSISNWGSYLSLAKNLGFLELAAAPTAPVDCGELVRDWVARAFHGNMHWFARGLDKRLDPSKVMAEVASVLVLTIPYHKEPCRLAGKKLARYACGDDYHDVLLEKLRLLCTRIREDYPKAALRPYVDTGPVLERYWAREAGLGWIGKNGNLISRKDGSYLFLACILTNLKVPTGTRHDDFCGSCRACIDACPTDAIVADGVVDSRKCISYLNIEHRGPFENAPAFDDWLFGCDICQEVCPWTVKFSNEEVLDTFRPRPEYESVTEETLAAMDAESFSRTFRKSPIKRTKREGLQRNLAHLLK